LTRLFHSARRYTIAVPDSGPQRIALTQIGRRQQRRNSLAFPTYSVCYRWKACALHPLTIARRRRSVMTEEPKVRSEEFTLSGSELVDKVKELIHQGNIRRIAIKQDGDTVMELPLTVAAVGVVLAPVLAAVGAFAALVSKCSIVVERIEED
jgi:hypothetical protein